ncbi:MAG: TSUP family transporter [Flavisolibacter sp.]|nr:TSUP family transporter [Flavisolibacter sp.]MBD0374224.1 TSUP family transporter [Flavisolibacter sp.]
MEEVSNRNHLFPVFLKLEELSVLVVGGGNVGLEKLHAILQNAPATHVKLVALSIKEEIRQLAAEYPHVQLTEKAFDVEDLDDVDIVVIAIDDHDTSENIRNAAKVKGKLVNVADKPDLCDFYLGSIVHKGNLKIAISTNGKSPTIAKRLKEMFNELLPDELDNVLENMHHIRNKLHGDFAHKVKRLDALTRDLAIDGKSYKAGEKYWRRIATWSLFAFFFMFVGYFVLSYIPFHNIWLSIRDLPQHIDNKFYWMIAAGFLAQLVDGALGMGYGVTCTTILLSIGVNLPAISGSIHTAEMFSSGASGYSHYRFGNVNKRLFKALLIPGIIGAVVGAFLLAKLGDKHAVYIRPLLAAYTMFLGIRILSNAFRKQKRNRKVKRVGLLAWAGGFLDSFGGGGWGPLVTSTLISKGRTPKYVIGSVSITEFFVTLASALTFFSLLGISHWQVIMGLIIGGVAAAPIAARLAGKLPLKTMFICVGAMVIIWSLRILWKVLF